MVFFLSKIGETGYFRFVYWALFANNHHSSKQIPRLFGSFPLEGEICQYFGEKWASENRLFERETSDGWKKSILKGYELCLIIRKLECKVCLRRLENEPKWRVLRADLAGEISNYIVLSWQSSSVTLANFTFQVWNHPTSSPQTWHFTKIFTKFLVFSQRLFSALL